jgi:hypothetical protein
MGEEWPTHSSPPKNIRYRQVLQALLNLCNFNICIFFDPKKGRKFAELSKIAQLLYTALLTFGSQPQIFIFVQDSCLSPPSILAATVAGSIQGRKECPHPRKIGEMYSQTQPLILLVATYYKKTRRSTVWQTDLPHNAQYINIYL